MKILLDMNVSPEWVSSLQKHEIECLHWSSVGDIRAEDVIIFEWANMNGYVILTHDLDFGAILAATNAQFPSVIQIRSQCFFPEDFKPLRLLRYLFQYEKELAQGALVTIDENKSRVRILPIRER